MTSFLLCFSILGIFYLIVPRIRILSYYRIPASLLGGLFVLLVFSFFPEMKKSEIYSNWKEWPGITIALVFSALFLEVRKPMKISGRVGEVYLQISYVMFSIIGQMLVGVLLTLLIFSPFYKLPLAFASVLENGFAGGHGTAVAMKEIYISNSLPSGSDLSLFSATIGIVLGIVGGVAIVSFSRGKNYSHFEREERLTGIDFQKIFTNLGLIASGVLLGYTGKKYLEIKIHSFPEFPLFVYSLIAAVFIRYSLRIFKKASIVNNPIMAFFSGFFMDLLIFTAVGTMNLNLIRNSILPLFILFSIGFLWNLYCHFFVSKKILPGEYGFELSILNFGMLNGTTAIGLMLLKMMDPDLKSNAVKIYAEAAPITSIFVGGGILTFSLPYILNQQGGWITSILLLVLMLFFYFTGLFWKNHMIKKGRWV